MNQISKLLHTLRANSLLVYFQQLLLVFGVAILFSPCQGKGDRPNNVPEEAKYNRKTNLYQLVQEGKDRSWFQNGTLVVETEVNEFGISNGLSQRFDYVTGVVIASGNYQNLERSGVWKWNFSDGKAYYEMNFTPGVRKKSFWMATLEWGNENGPYYRYFKNGRISEKGFYDGGNRTGDWLKYYPDTKIESKGSYANDKKAGEWFYYYPDGRKEAYEKYSDLGEFEYRVTYYPNGTVWCETKKGLSAICS
ncbi:toxin-antitoxin system YwqK family antitoxin [Leptospira idonii]|uniref:Toxin-antitoxin system YwqK family antitoxin n=1 Tax=Leptospira idonii TaxID=1193500 RepID=A0A4R9M4V1_9LEPT|nr:hypothetical protein [Leptospira idonii]TGN21102.1 hypothetical protein EHS15_00865 [Leptospira idonii]